MLVGCQSGAGSLGYPEIIVAILDQHDDPSVFAHLKHGKEGDDKNDALRHPFEHRTEGDLDPLLQP